MNQTEKLFNKILINSLENNKIIWMSPKFEKLNIFKLNYKDEFISKEVNMYQVPDFIVLRKNGAKYSCRYSVDIIEVKNNFVHQDYPFREKLMRLLISQKQQKIIQWFEENNNKNFNLSIENTKINYLVLQPNHLKITWNEKYENIYGKEFTEYYYHKNAEIEAETYLKKQARIFLVNFKVLFFAILKSLQFLNDKNLLLYYDIINKVKQFVKKFENKKLIVDSFVKNIVDKFNCNYKVKINCLINLINNFFIYNSNKNVYYKEISKLISNLNSLHKNNKTKNNYIKFINDNIVKSEKNLTDFVPKKYIDSKILKDIKITLESLIKLQPWRYKRKEPFKKIKKEINDIIKTFI